MRKFYRICNDSSLVTINVPHSRHDNFISDPTHIRPITPMTLKLFDLEQNQRWQTLKGANSTIAIHTGVNFKLINTYISLD
jgi:hypothetical protein